MELAPQPVDEQKPRASTGWGGARPGAGRKKDAGKADDYSRLAKARADHEELKAALRDLEVKQKTGELLPRDEVARAWAEQVAIAKGRLLALPSRVSADVLRLKSQREIERVIKAALIVILEELANDATRYGLPDGAELP